MLAPLQGLCDLRVFFGFFLSSLVLIYLHLKLYIFEGITLLLIILEGSLFLVVKQRVMK